MNTSGFPFNLACFLGDTESGTVGPTPRRMAIVPRVINACRVRILAELADKASTEDGLHADAFMGRLGGSDAHFAFGAIQMACWTADLEAGCGRTGKEATDESRKNRGGDHGDFGECCLRSSLTWVAESFHSGRGISTGTPGLAYFLACLFSGYLYYDVCLGISRAHAAGSTTPWR